MIIIAKIKSFENDISSRIGHGLDKFELAGLEGFSKIQRYANNSQNFSNLIFSKENIFDKLNSDKEINIALKDLNESLLNINLTDLVGVEELDEKLKCVLEKQFEITTSVLDLGMYHEQRKLNYKLLLLTYVITFLTLVMLVFTYLTYINQGTIS